MCGRYTIGGTDPRAFDDRFGGQVDLDALGRYNVAPTQPVPIVSGGPGVGERTTRLASWGLLAPWARSRRDRLKPINARAEELPGKKLFAPLVGDARHRVLVLADGWYEWLRAEDGRKAEAGGSVPFHHVVDGGAPIAFAGLARSVRVADEPGPAGFEALEPRMRLPPRPDRPDDGRIGLRTVAIVTCAANAVAARLHDRMPAVLAGPEEEAAWLDPAVSAEEALELLRPLPEDRLSVAPASTRVNRVDPDVDGPSLLVPDAPGVDGTPGAGGDARRRPEPGA